MRSASSSDSITTALDVDRGATLRGSSRRRVAARPATGSQGLRNVGPVEGRGVDGGIHSSRTPALSQILVASSISAVASGARHVGIGRENHVERGWRRAAQRRPVQISAQKHDATHDPHDAHP